MSAGDLLLFGNLSQPPFCNNLYPPLRALQKVFRTTLVEPLAPLGLRLDRRSEARPDPGRRRFSARRSAAAGRRLSRRRAPSLVPGPPDVPLGHAVRRVRAVGSSGPRGLARDRARVRPLLHAGRPDASGVRRPRNHGSTLRPRHGSGALPAAQGRARVATSSTTGSGRPTGTIFSRRSRRVSPCGSMRTRARSDGPFRRGLRSIRPMPSRRRSTAPGSRSRPRSSTTSTGKYRGTFRLTPRALFAASCGVPTLVESFPRLAETFEPGLEIATFPTKDEVVLPPRRSSGTSRRASPWAAAPASGSCASTPGIGGSSPSSSTSPPGARTRAGHRRASHRQ